MAQNARLYMLKPAENRAEAFRDREEMALIANGAIANGYVAQSIGGPRLSHASGQYESVLTLTPLTSDFNAHEAANAAADAILMNMPDALFLAWSYA